MIHTGGTESVQLESSVCKQQIVEATKRSRSPLAFGLCLLAFGLWSLAFGLWPLVVVLWPSVFGFSRLVFGLLPGPGMPTVIGHMTSWWYARRAHGEMNLSFERADCAFRYVGGFGSFKTHIRGFLQGSHYPSSG